MLLALTLIGIAIVIAPIRAAIMARVRLTEREREVLSLVAAGLQHKEIAQALALSRHTVSTHVRNIGAKLGARSVANAVALAIISGQMDPAHVLAIAVSPATVGVSAEGMRYAAVH